MNYNSEEFIQGLINKNERIDGRKFDEYRKPILVELGVSAKSAEGSARVKIGETEVVAGVKLAIEKPYPDRADEGTIVVNAELLPLSSPDFESGPPGIDSIELSRVVDRGIRESKSINFKKLCMKEGEKVWMVYIDIYPINDAGNLFDAAALAALAALRDAVFPVYDAEKELVTYEKTKTKLPLEKTPISVSVIKIRGKYLVDPIIEEEHAAEARLTVVSSDDTHICAMQKGGPTPLTIEEIDDMVTIALKKRKELATLVEKAK